VDQATLDALAVATATRVPVLLWGSPGTGKSSVVRALAEQRGVAHEVVIASIREPSDFAGLPVIEGGTVHFAPPAWARRLADAGEGILFLDELSTAPPAVQAALLRVVLERVVGDLVLPEAVSIVAAANPPDQIAHGWDLSAPLANRFCHVAWEVEPRTVAHGLASGFAVAFPPAAMADAPAAARSLVGAFLVARPGLACVPPTEASAAGHAWPSPRSWEMLALLWAAAASLPEARQAPVRSIVARGAVGDGPGAEFLAWVTELDLPDPELVLAAPTSYALPDRADRAHAFLSAVASAVATNPTPERWRAGWRVLGHAAGEAPDVAAAAARVLARCRPQGAPPPPELQVFIPLLTAADLLDTP
jgi:hypothetical protein